MENLENNRDLVMDMKIVINNPEKLKEKKDFFRQSGFDKVHVLSDFDRTLTYGSVDGVKTPSIISMLRDGKHLSEGYAKKAHALYDKYHIFENDLNIPEEKRKRMMKEWWDTHNALLAESELSRADLEDIVENGHVRFREGVEDFLDFLHERNIPLVIMSASGCGDAVEMFFKKVGKNYSNIYYVTNQFEWDKNGRVVKAKEPVIHSLNKDETVLSDLPDVYGIVKNRKNVILLGDGLHDLDMVNGFDYENIISVGFQNSGEKEKTAEYSSQFDVVLQGDRGFKPVNDLMKELE